MTWIDGLVLVVIALSALVAFSRGFLREALGLAAWLGAAWFAWATRGLTEPLVAQLAIDPLWIGEWIAIGVVFLVALLLIRVVATWAADVASGGAFTTVDRVLGLGFGAARGALLLVAAYIAAGVLLPAVDRWPTSVRDAASLPRIAAGAGWLTSFAPPELRPRLPSAVAPSGPTQQELLRPPPEPRQ